MAKGKKKGSGSSGPRKMHGPKRHLFKDYKPLVQAFAGLGLLNKYNNYESFCLACNARGKRKVSKIEFSEFKALSREKQDEYFKSLGK